MIKRPLSVTIIAWLLIVLESVFFITQWKDIKLKEALNHNTPSILLQFKLTFQLLLPLISGIGMLKRQNWARHLYAICWIFFFVIYIVRGNPMTTGIMGGTVLFLITIFFLFRPIANDYFSRK